jgi:hypothetical protein
MLFVWHAVSIFADGAFCVRQCVRDSGFETIVERSTPLTDTTLGDHTSVNTHFQQPVNVQGLEYFPFPALGDLPEGADVNTHYQQPINYFE